MSAPKAFSFDGKVVLITGASSGIGKKTAIEFARHGANVALTGNDLAGLQDASAKCTTFGKKPHVIYADFFNDGDIGKIMSSTIEQFGKLDVLVNNAAVVADGGIIDGTLEDFDRVFHINTRSVYQLTNFAVPHLKKSQGNIINVSDTAGQRAYYKTVALSTSKAALDHFTRCTALELAPYQIRVNGVAPGLIMTEFKVRDAQENEEFYQNWMRLHPFGQAGSMADVAELILFLASDKAEFITAAVVPVDGGLHAVVAK